MRVQSGSIVSSTGQQGNTTRSGNYLFVWGDTDVRVSVTSSQPNQHGVVHSEYKINIRGPQQSVEFTTILNALQSYVVDDSNSLLRRNSI